MAGEQKDGAITSVGSSDQTKNFLSRRKELDAAKQEEFLRKLLNGPLDREETRDFLDSISRALGTRVEEEWKRIATETGGSRFIQSAVVNSIRQRAVDISMAVDELDEGRGGPAASELLNIPCFLLEEMKTKNGEKGSFTDLQIGTIGNNLVDTARSLVQQEQIKNVLS